MKATTKARRLRRCSPNFALEPVEDARADDQPGDDRRDEQRPQQHPFLADRIIMRLLQRGRPEAVDIARGRGVRIECHRIFPPRSTAPCSVDSATGTTASAARLSANGQDATVPAPMEALLAAELPEGEGWQFEPKWDGFRCLARRDGDEVTLTSKSGKPLGALFPRRGRRCCAGLKDEAFLLDGELIIPVGDALVVRRAAAAPAPGRKPRPQARRRDSGGADAVRRCSSSAARS